MDATDRPDRPYAAAAAKLRAAGLRPTRQRLGLARLIFAGAHRHVTADSLRVEAEAAGLRLATGTIYNTLKSLRAAGLLAGVRVDGPAAHFDTNVAQHQHFHVPAEDRLIDIPEGEIAFAALPDAPPGYAIERIDVVVRLRRV